MSEQADDRVRGARDEVGCQVWRRVRATEADHEQSAARCPEHGDAGQGVIEVQMVQHGHHRDEVSFTVTGRGAELLEAAPAMITCGL